MGEGLTLCETSSILSPLVKFAIGFTVMKDISSNRKIETNGVSLFNWITKI